MFLSCTVLLASKRVYNYPFLMGQGVWLDSDKLSPNDEVREVLKHGTLSIGFIGLAETLTALYGHHHGESDEMQQKGLEIIRYMRAYCDRKSEETKMNFSLLATPAEGLSGRFIRMDKKRFGVIPGVTDKDYYTNSFHIPVWYNTAKTRSARLFRRNTGRSRRFSRLRTAASSPPATTATETARPS